MKSFLGKIFYGALFVVLFPSLLYAWSFYTDAFIDLPVPQNNLLSGIFGVVGLLFVIVGMLNLWLIGKGLPMNAYPPQNFVTRGVYSIASHPIYLGTIIISFSVSSYFKSASGFWLVSPVLVLMIVAYVIGFENERTEKVFGLQKFRPFLSLPISSNETPSIKERIATTVLVFIPWILIYEAFIFLGPSRDSFATNLKIDQWFPVIESSVIFYISVYFIAFFIPFVVSNKSALRNFILDAWFATAISALIYFVVPAYVNQVEFTPETFFGQLILLDRSLDGSSAAIPAFHVIWAFIAARYFSQRFPKLKLRWYTFAILISISCLTTGNHSVADVLAGFFVFVLTINRNRIWDLIRSLTEKIANSWKEWRIGPVRIINHGIYAGLSAFIGTLIINSFFPVEYSFIGTLLCVFGIVGAALWAQFIEGSPSLQRPFGYYGGVFGIMLGGILVVLLFNIDYVVIIAAFSIAAPWMQIIGRLRCLVQGCCHGKPAGKEIGIHFHHPLSRVNAVSGLKGACIHPTQLYSIASNIVTGLILIRLLVLDMPATFIIGIYFILNALCRFVEEFYRGETQTPYWLGMRIYQWLAILFVITGVFFSSIESLAMPSFNVTPYGIGWAILLGVVSFFAYGVDFPNSTKRFARLASVGVEK